MSIIVMITMAIIVVVVVAYLEIRRKSPSYQQRREFNTKIKSVTKEHKGLRKQGRVKAIEEGSEILAKIDPIIEDYKQQLLDPKKRDIAKSVRVYAVTSSNKRPFIAFIIAIGITAILFVPGMLILMMLTDGLNWTLELSATIIGIIGVGALVIGLTMSYLLLRVPKDKSEKAKKQVKLKDLKLVIGKIDLTNTKNKYYDEGVGAKYVLLTIISKLLIFGLLIFSIYIIVVSILGIVSISLLEIYYVINSVFVFLSISFYLTSMRKLPMQRFELFGLFFSMLGIYTLFSIFRFDWKFYYYLIVFGACIFLSISAFLLHRKNRIFSIRTEKEKEGFISRNISNLVFLNFLFIDISVFFLFIFYIDYSNLDLLTIDAWIPLIFLITTIISVGAFMRENFTSSDDLKTKFSIKSLIGPVLATTFGIWTIFIMYNTLGAISLLLVLSHNTLQCIIYILNATIFYDFKNIGIKLKQKFKRK